MNTGSWSSFTHSYWPPTECPVPQSVLSPGETSRQNQGPVLRNLHGMMERIDQQVPKIISESDKRYWGEKINQDDREWLGQRGGRGGWAFPPESPGEASLEKWPSRRAWAYMKAPVMRRSGASSPGRGNSWCQQPGGLRAWDVRVRLVPRDHGRWVPGASRRQARPASPGAQEPGPGWAASTLLSSF